MASIGDLFHVFLKCRRKFLGSFVADVTDEYCRCKCSEEGLKFLSKDSFVSVCAGCLLSKAEIEIFGFWL